MFSCYICKQKLKEYSDNHRECSCGQFQVLPGETVVYGTSFKYNNSSIQESNEVSKKIIKFVKEMKSK